MKLFAKSVILIGLAASFGAVALPARADWYDGHHYHHGRIPYGWRYDRHLHYYIYEPGYAYSPPGGIVITQPAQPPVVVAPAPQPQVIYEQPAPVYIAPQPPPPMGIGLGIHIR